MSALAPKAGIRLSFLMSVSPNADVLPFKNLMKLM
jgi:hypothetical protein